MLISSEICLKDKIRLFFNDEKDFIISHWPITRTIAMDDYTKPHLTFIVRGYIIQERGYVYPSVV